MIASVGNQVRELPVALAVSDFERFLAVVRGVSAMTTECYVRHVEVFLAEAAGAGAVVEFGDLSAQFVRSYVTTLGGRYAPRSLKLMATAIRSFWALRGCQAGRPVTCGLLWGW